MRRGGVRKHVVVLFSDVRGFTSFSEAREPEEVVSMLNAYLNTRAQMVRAHLGDIDKFVGDELMAIFYGEDAELRAVRCAVDMIEAVRRLNEAEGRSLDPVTIGVGINASAAIVGAMGSEDRMDFTAIGDTIDVGARLLERRAIAGPRLEQRARKIGDRGDLTFTPLDPLSVKGKARPVPVFAVVATREAHIH